MNAKEKALAHRAKIGSFFKAAGTKIASGAKTTWNNGLKPAGVYVKTMVIGDRDIEAEQRQLRKERLERLNIAPDSFLGRRLMEQGFEEEAVKKHVIIIAAANDKITP